jgi:hypothetical protein
MSSQNKWKLLSGIIIASVVLGVAGWQQFAPTPTSPTTVTITPAVTTVAGSQTTVVPVKPTEWIRIGEVKPVDYYLSLLYSNGTSPYGHLYWELRKLPELTNATAVAKITYLALNATNPEVKEAFGLMIKGGTPYPGDFKYSVPDYNTELQVLYWLAEQNEFKKDDTLVLAVAMDNGLWLTIGDDLVKQDVRNDTTQLLRFFRDANELQQRNGYFQLEDYPLEAKICLAYTSSLGTFDGPHSLFRFTQNRAGQRDYRWVRCDIDSLMKMARIAFEKGWRERSVDSTVKNLEEYFFFSGMAQHWTYSTISGDISGVTESLIEVEGELVPDHWIYNLRFYLERYVRTDRGLGDCGDETYFMEAWCKCLGIATDFVVHQIIVEGKYRGHAHMIYYEPVTKGWKAYARQLDDRMYGNNPDLQFYVFLFRIPVKLASYFSWSSIKEARMGMSGAFYVARYTSVDFRRVYQDGCPTSQMKQWLLYS